MAEQTAFGRRRVASVPNARQSRDAPAANAADALALSAAAEAFRAGLNTAPRAEPSDFAEWLRGRRGRRVFAWVVGLALLSPGALCFVLQTPWYVSGGLELAGFGVNWWLRRERRRHLREISTWESSNTAE